MMERELRDRLAAAVSDEPPLWLDPDALVARAQRGARRRRSLTGVGVATVAIAILAVAVPAVLHVERGTGAPTIAAANQLTSVEPTRALTGDPAPPNTTVDPRSTVWPPPGTQPEAYSLSSASASARQWSALLTTTITGMTPSVQKLAVRPWGPLAEHETVGKVYQLSTFATFLVRGHSAALQVEVRAPGVDISGPAACEQGANTVCQAYRESTSVVTVAQNKKITLAGLQQLTVTEYRADGSVVAVTGYDYDPLSQEPPTAGVPAPFTVGQLTALADDHDLAF